MRLASTTLFVSTLVPVLLVTAIHPHALSRRDYKRSPDSQLLASRQHHAPHALLDVCINVKVDLLADASKLLGLGSALGSIGLGTDLRLCLCLKDLDLYLQSNNDVHLLVNVLGKNAVSTAITTLVNTSPRARHCSFPPNAHHTCNNGDPCHFECDPNYTRRGSSCVCAPPYMSCNGVCGLFSSGCVSPHAWKQHSGRIVTIGQAKATCKPHQTVCGLPGRQHTLEFECIDTNATKDSCGGCLTHHPFVETETTPAPPGKDCTRIANAKTVGCANQRCMIHTCDKGWVPSPAQDECVLDHKFSSKIRRVKRSISSANAALGLNVSTDLLAQLVDIVQLVLGLTSDLPPTSIPSLSDTASTTSDLMAQIDATSARLLTSSTVGGLLANLKALLNLTQLLGTTMSNCGCAGDLGLSLQTLEATTTALSKLLDWCGHNPIVLGITDGPNPSSPNDLASSTTTPAGQPIIIGLTDLLNTLGFKGRSGVIVSGLGGGLSETVNNFLNGLSLGPNNYDGSYPAAVVNADLLSQIAVFADLVTKLQGDASGVHSLTGSPSLDSLAPNLVGSVVKSTTNLLSAPTVSNLVSSVSNLVLTATAAQKSLLICCADTLGLKVVLADLTTLANMALQMQAWCNTHPVALPGSSLSSSITIPNTSNIPVIIGLPHLISALTSPSMGGTLVGGLGSGFSDPVNQLLNGIGIDSLDSTNVKGTVVHDSDLLSQLGVITNLADKLGSSGISSTLLDPTLVTKVVQATDDLAGSTTVTSLLPTIDSLLSSTSALRSAMESCGCAGSLGNAAEYLVLLTEAILKLRNWCGSHPTVVPLSIATRPPAKSGHSSGPTILPVGIGSPATTAGSHSSIPTPKTALPVGINSPSSLSRPISSPTKTSTPSSPTSHALSPTKSTTPSHSTTSAAQVTTPHTPAPVPSSKAHSSGSNPGDNNDTPIIIALNHLLGGLGFEHDKGVVSVHGLGNPISSSTNELLDGLRIGPMGTRRREPRNRRRTTES